MVFADAIHAYHENDEGIAFLDLRGRDVIDVKNLSQFFLERNAQLRRILQRLPRNLFTNGAPDICFVVVERRYRRRS